MNEINDLRAIHRTRRCGKLSTARRSSGLAAGGAPRPAASATPPPVGAAAGAAGGGAKHLPNPENLPHNPVVAKAAAGYPVLAGAGDPVKLASASTHSPLSPHRGKPCQPKKI